MAGHMGDAGHDQEAARRPPDGERNLLLVKGTLRGAKNALDPGEEGLTMPQTTLYDRKGASVGKVELNDDLFAAPVNAAVLHQVVVAQLAGRHLGTSDTKTRGEVRGGGRKPYRQKGTGRARQGHRDRAPLPGRRAVFGPHPRSYEQRLPRKMKRLALRGALTAKFGDDAIRVIDTFGLEAIKTRDFVDVLAPSRPAAGSSSCRRAATRSSSSRRATCRRSR